MLLYILPALSVMHVAIALTVSRLTFSFSLFDKEKVVVHTHTQEIKSYIASLFGQHHSMILAQCAFRIPPTFTVTSV